MAENAVENDKHRCPKCGGLTYSSFFAEFKLSKCAICGLSHHLGSSKESLKKQILGDAYVNPLGSMRTNSTEPQS